MESISVEAHKRNKHLIIAGDWNAEAGARQNGEEDGALGEHGHGIWNGRGNWLVKWATMNELVISNTIFEKTWTPKWTHSIDGRKRTTDYILIEKLL